MNTFIIGEKQKGVLTPLRVVVKRLSFVAAARWCFRQITVHNGLPFGLTVQEFERLTRERPEGYCVADCEMREFLDSDIQVIDGEVDGIAEDGRELFTIECVDATQWEIRTALPRMVLELTRTGFKERDD